MSRYINNHINSLKSSGIYVPPALTIINCAFCIYVSRTTLSVSIHYFVKFQVLAAESMIRAFWAYCLHHHRPENGGSTHL
jgi:hypothetical protein